MWTCCSGKKDIDEERSSLINSQLAKEQQKRESIEIQNMQKHIDKQENLTQGVSQQVNDFYQRFLSHQTELKKERVTSKKSMEELELKVAQTMDLLKDLSLRSEKKSMEAGSSQKARGVEADTLRKRALEVGEETRKSNVEMKKSLEKLANVVGVVVGKSTSKQDVEKLLDAKLSTMQSTVLKDLSERFVEGQRKLGAELEKKQKGEFESLRKAGVGAGERTQKLEEIVTGLVAKMREMYDMQKSLVETVTGMEKRSKLRESLSMLSGSGDMSSLQKTPSSSQKEMKKLLKMRKRTVKKTESIKEFGIGDLEGAVEEDLGGGQFKCVYRVVLSGNTYAWNVIKTQDRLPQEFQRLKASFMNEVKILCSLNHPNILRVYGVCTENNRLSFLTEFCPTSIVKILDDLDWNRKCEILYQIVEAMCYLHENGIIHRTNYTEKVDVYSFAMMMFCFLHSVDDPHTHNRNESNDGFFDFQIDSLVEFNGLRPKDPPDYEVTGNHIWFYQLMTRCWDQDAAKRPSFHELRLIFEKNYQIS